MSRTRMRLSLLGILAAGILGMGLFAYARRGSDAGPLVLRAQRVERELPRAGRMRTLTQYQGRQVVSVLDAAYGSGGRHRLAYRTPPLDGVLCIANPPHLWRLDPGRDLLEEDGCPAPEVEQPDPDLLLANYDARLLGQGRVAGRRVNRVVMLRRHAPGIARRLWLDQETGLPLRTEEYGARGNLVASTEYLTVSFGPPQAALFARPEAPGVRVAFAKQEQSHAHGNSDDGPPRAALPRYVPTGYRQEHSRTFTCFCGCGQPALHTCYEDGLESLSLFECSHETEQMSNSAVSSFGQDNVASRVHQGHTFVAVGRVAPRELEQMLQSIP
ncbi:MAG: hypothetical protein HY321_05860 [Armatimonadetes bacterium]|nr:hypothetical protein [Armatimonadota bacterium]